MVESPRGAQADSGDELMSAIVRELGKNAAKAAFVGELRPLAPSGTDGDNAFERSLDALDAEGRILVRTHSCGDPHMAKVDLRIASLIGSGDAPGAGRDALPESDPIHLAVRRDQALWDEWITEFLRNHRCQ